MDIIQPNWILILVIVAIFIAIGVGLAIKFKLSPAEIVIVALFASFVVYAGTFSLNTVLLSGANKEALEKEYGITLSKDNWKDLSSYRSFGGEEFTTYGTTTLVLQKDKGELQQVTVTLVSENNKAYLYGTESTGDILPLDELLP